MSNPIARIVQRGLRIFGLQLSRLPMAKVETTVRVGDYNLRCNEGHQLPRILNAYPRYSINIGRIAYYVKKQYQAFTMVDIGANIGDTVGIVRNICQCPIVCIEGDPFYFQILGDNMQQFNDVRAFNCFLGERTERIRGATELNGGTLRIVKTCEANHIEVLSLDDFIMSHDIRGLIKLIKIDTDGYDMKIVRGGIKVIEKYKPILFFEYDRVLLADAGDNGISTIQGLKSIGYDTALFYDNYGRFLLSTSLKESRQIEQLHNYIGEKQGAFPYYDLCLIHETDADLAASIIESEMNLQ